MELPSPHPGRGRLSAGAITLAVHLGLAALFLFALTEHGRTPPRQFDPASPITEVPLPPPPTAHPRHSRVARAAPRPRLARPEPAPAVIAAPAPRIIPAIVPLSLVQGPAAGGGGGIGGAGSGAGGNGEGGDGSGGGGGGMPPRRIGGRVTDRDYPRGLSEAGISGTVSVRYRVGVDGRVSNCLVTHSSGSDALDTLTCQLIERRFRFRPSRDEEGHTVPSIIVENHSWIIPPAPPPAGEGGGGDHSQR